MNALIMNRREGMKMRLVPTLIHPEESMPVLGRYSEHVLIRYARVCACNGQGWIRMDDELRP